jgi:nucleotide-binding universal stress UspA family protein
MSAEIPTVQAYGEPRIVVGVDGSSYAASALDYASYQAERMDALLLVVCAYGMLPVEDSLIIPINLIHDDAAIVVREAVERVGEMAPDVVAKGEIVLGSPGPTLVEESEGALALVVGTRGHEDIVGARLGSVSEYVVHYATCTTIVVR